MKSAKLIKPFRIAKGHKFRLADHDPADTAGLDDEKAEAKAMLAGDIARLADLQERLYAERRWALLVILQGMDASGKDGVVKHVMGGVNPLGCVAHAFRAPHEEELDHDFLWRAVWRLPERGRIGIFNRSYYEEVVVVRVRPGLLERERLPPDLVDKRMWNRRCEDIAAFERYLGRNGIRVLKFFLNISKEEQTRRFLARLDEPEKRWKFSMDDVEDRKLWDRYMAAYEEAIRRTATAEAPWYVVPADHKWFARLVVAAAIVEAVERLDPRFPEMDAAALRRMDKVRALLAEK